MRNIKLEISYDGTNYCGWQIQPNAESVSGEIIKAIKYITGKDVNLYGSGRTDAGVHALGQVANFYTESDIPTEQLKNAINSRLNKDIAILSVSEEDQEFNARFSAKSKTYRYLIDNSQTHSPFLLNRAWQYKYPLNIDEMNAACEILKGEHDFFAFMATGSKVKSTVRTIYTISCEKHENLIELNVHGNGFLYNMVRIIAGTLVYVGGGKLKSSDVEQMLLSKDRKKGGLTAPSHGLYLMKVYYLH